MDKIQLLQERKAKIAEAGKDIRARIQAIVDEESFVELSAFSFSKNEFYGEDVAGEGVVTGFATVDGYPLYIVAQNFKVMDGGISKAACEKIAKCLDTAEKNSTPILYLLNTRGVQVGEGVTVLEGLGKVFAKSAKLKGIVPQYVVVDGEVYGSVAMLAAIADFTFFIDKKSVLAINSPFVLSAKANKNLPKEEVGCAKALDKTGIPAFVVSEISEILGKETIDLYNTGESRGKETSHSLNYQKTGKELMSMDELSVMDGSKCILQLRGVRPFLSNKYDLTKHPKFALTADADERNLFDVEKYLSHKLTVKPNTVVEVYDCSETNEDDAKAADE